MAREIKFRVWDKQNKIMIYDVSFSNNIWYRGSFATIECEIIGMEPTIQPMQYTGLKDKNGEEIYEGDIVQRRRGKGYFHRKPFIVEWGWNIKKGGNLVEVIGNIYENPELLDNK